MEQNLGMAEAAVLTPISRGQDGGLSWPAGAPIAKRTLIYEGRKYRLRIYGKGRHGKRRYIAMAKVDGRLIQAPDASDESRAQAGFIKLIDPEVDIVRDIRGTVLS
jgi:hypothetical protein